MEWRFKEVGQVGIELTTKRIMRAGESLFIQNKPTAMNKKIETIVSKIYWFEPDFVGYMCTSLHRQCTV